MSQVREIQRRIKSISNIKKITRAMEMISAIKMKKSIDFALKTRTYSNLSWLTVINLAETIKNNNNIQHPLLTKKEKINNVLIVLITSNKGLCGNFNTAIINKVINSIKKHEDQKNKIKNYFILIGKKGVISIKKMNYDIVADFTKKDSNISINDVIPVAKMMIDGFINNKYDKVMVAYTNFVNQIKQEPHIRQILPIELDTYTLGIMKDDVRLSVNKDLLKNKEEKYLKMKNVFKYEYLFEPDPFTVLDMMLPRLIEIQLYQAILESNASEHSQRMNTMHQATDSAQNIISELNLNYNKVRQASITSEIAEISSGAEALQ